jgi:predicted DNA-binding transcriptional regulator AlpA
MRTLRLQAEITVDGDELAGVLEEVFEKAAGGHVGKGKPPSPLQKMTPKEASQHALFGGQKPPEDRGLLIDTKQTAKLLNVCEKTVWTMYKTRKMPQPIRIGQRVLWGYEKLRAWVNAGCPRDEEWQWPGH